MACGFGAVTLLFLILKHNPISTEFIDLAGTSEKKILLEEIQTGKENLLRLKNTLTLTDENTVKIIEDIKKIQEEVIEAKKTFLKYKWPTIDVTRKSVEEVAASIIKIHEIYKNNV